MIDTIKLKQSVDQLAKAGTSGYQSVDEFNNDVRLVQQSVLTMFSEMYEREEVISDALAPFVLNIPISNTKPLDYHRFVAAEINGKEVYPISANKVSMTKTSPIRKPDVSGQSYYYFEDNQVKFLYPTVFTGTMTYIRQPKESVLEVVYAEDSYTDYEEYTVAQNLEWPEFTENLFLFLLLERLGISQKDNLVIEYSKLGLQYEAAKLQ